MGMAVLCYFFEFQLDSTHFIVQQVAGLIKDGSGNRGLLVCFPSQFELPFHDSALVCEEVLVDYFLLLHPSAFPKI